MGEASKTLEDLGKIPELLWDALEVAGQNVHHYFKDNTKIDSSLSPCIMRYVAKKYLKDNLWRVDSLFLEDLSGNGLSLFYKNYHIRIWKYTGRDLPTPGMSLTKDEFLRQANYEQLTLFSYLDNEKPVDNLVFLWDVDEEYQLKELRLSHPKPSMNTVDIRADWSIILEHPVSLMDSLPVGREDVSAYDLPLESLEELLDEEDSSETSS